MSKVAFIPSDVWEQIVSRPEVWIDFMACIEGVHFESDDDVRAELKRLCEKHNIIGLVFPQHIATRTTLDLPKPSRPGRLPGTKQ